jgi:hypothetical protein
MRHITKCLNAKLADLCERNIQIETLNLMLKNYLPQELQANCAVGSFNRGCLVLIIKDPVWATQLRFMLPELRDKLRKDAGLYQLSSINIQAFIEPTIKITKKIKSRTLSSKARVAINNTALQCSYEPLQKALQKLSNTL